MSALDIRDHHFLGLVSELERRKNTPAGERLWVAYESLAKHMFETEFKGFDLGILVREGDLYTIHGTPHVLEVIQNIGNLLGNKLADLPARDIYILLCAALLHDYGNIDGRHDHNKKAKVFIDEHPDLFESEWSLLNGIGVVAEAHGGVAADGSFDTIAGISLGSQFQFLAAVLRLADELADNSNRTYPSLLSRDLIPDQSLPHHRYCRAIKEVRIADANIEMTILLSPDDLPVLSGTQRETSLLEFVDRRLSKTQAELRLASRYFYPLLPPLTAAVRLGVLRDGSRTESRRETKLLPFEGQLTPAKSFFQQCSQLTAQGVSTPETLAEWFFSQ